MKNRMGKRLAAVAISGVAVFGFEGTALAAHSHNLDTPGTTVVDVARGQTSKVERPGLPQVPRKRSPWCSGQRWLPGQRPESGSRLRDRNCGLYDLVALAPPARPNYRSATQRRRS